MPVTPELLDQTKALVERALHGKLTHHLGYEKYVSGGKHTGNSRNGTSPKTVKGKRGQVQIDVPRDRTGEFELRLIKQGQMRFDGLDEKIISLYARGMTTREIHGQLEALDGVEVSPSLISTVTDAVLEEVRACQNRPLDAVYPILYVDAIQVEGPHTRPGHQYSQLAGLRRDAGGVERRAGHVGR